MNRDSKPSSLGKGSSVPSSTACVMALFVVALATSQPSAKAQTPAPPAARNTARTAPKTPIAASTTVSYDQMVEHAKALTALRPQDAVALCKQAIQRDPSRYEAHVIAASALRQQKQYSQAIVHLQISMGLAPQDETLGIRRALAETRLVSLPADRHRKFDGLMLILKDAQTAQSSENREQFLREFLVKSDPFLAEYPMISDLWLIRAQIAVEIDDPKIGWQAARKLISFGEDQREDPATRNLMATLERRGWTVEKLSAGKALNDFIQYLNGIGEQKVFVPSRDEPIVGWARYQANTNFECTVSIENKGEMETSITGRYPVHEFYSMRLNSIASVTAYAEPLCRYCTHIVVSGPPDVQKMRRMHRDDGKIKTEPEAATTLNFSTKEIADKVAKMLSAAVEICSLE